MPWTIIRTYYWMKMAQSNAENSFTAGRIWSLKTNMNTTLKQTIKVNKILIQTAEKTHQNIHSYSMKQNHFIFVFYTTVSDLINTFVHQSIGSCDLSKAGARIFIPIRS